MQRANCLIYMLGGIFFVGGSTLFFPGLGRLIMHGGWLYISGCLLTLLGAILASVTAYEMMKTAHVRPCGVSNFFAPSALSMSAFLPQLMRHSFTTCATIVYSVYSLFV